MLGSQALETLQLIFRELNEPDLGFCNLLRNLLRNMLNLTWLCTKASRSLLRNLLRNPFEPDLALHQSLPDLLWNLLQNLLRNPVSHTFSGGFSGTSLNLTRHLHQCTPELFWAEDPLSLRCWGKQMTVTFKMMLRIEATLNHLFLGGQHGSFNDFQPSKMMKKLGFKP